MKSFEERRTDYFQKLRKYSEVIMKLSHRKIYDFYFFLKHIFFPM